MKPINTSVLLTLVLTTFTVAAQSPAPLKQALTFHASFDKGLDADFSRGDKACLVRGKQGTVPAALNEELKLVPDGGRFGGGLHFTKKGTTQPRFKDAGVLNYNATNWNASVSVWLRLDPDKDLAPGYCDPVQIVGDDTKKGFIFLEWSKDESPRHFRYAIRPLEQIWNPNKLDWAKMTAAQRRAAHGELPVPARDRQDQERHRRIFVQWEKVAHARDGNHRFNAGNIVNLYLN